MSKHSAEMIQNSKKEVDDYLIGLLNAARFPDLASQKEESSKKPALEASAEATAKMSIPAHEEHEKPEKKKESDSKASADFKLTLNFVKPILNAFKEWNKENVQERSDRFERLFKDISNEIVTQRF